MADYEQLWEDYSIEFNSKLVDFDGDWSKLDEEEQEIAALWKLDVDLNNGGFLEFFCNWGYECFYYAMRGLKHIGHTSLSKLLEDTYHDIFEKFKDDTRLTTYEDILQYLTEEEIERLEAVDEQFWETECDCLAQMAYEYYHEVSPTT